MPQFQRVDSTHIPEIAKRARVLIVTATNVETTALHNALRSLPPYKKRLWVASGTQTYYVGRLGKQGIIHVQCQMGSVAAGASVVTVLEAITQWNVAAVIMVGVAFGMDERTQKVGDVLISKIVSQYEIQRVGKKHTIQRGASPISGATLLNRFSNCRDWVFKLSRNAVATAKPVQILSGEKLIDNAQFRNRLKKCFPEAGGGEMEGAGLFAAAHQKNVEWILVKAICDFADGNKSRRKKINQATAASSAVSYCVHVLSQPGCLDALGCPDIPTGGRQPELGLDLDEVLFEVYEIKCEPAYLQRTVDVSLHEHASHHGFWLSGPSGSGKTNALRRGILQADKKCFFIDLSKCVGATLGEIFEDLYREISEAVGSTLENQQNQATANGQAFWIHKIAKVIEAFVDCETYFFIDEIPLANAHEFQGFVDGITAVIIILANRKVRNAKFLLCSIENPKPHIKEFQKKVFQHLRFVDLQRWKDQEILKLLTILLPLLGLKLDRETRTKIVEAAAGCPRRLKRILKLLATKGSSPEWSVDRILFESRS